MQHLKRLINNLNNCLMNNIQQIITSKETLAFRFKPKNLFFSNLGISKKRFYAFLKNEQQPTISEIERIAVALNVTPQELINFKNL